MLTKFEELRMNIGSSSGGDFDSIFYLIVEAYEKGEIDSNEYTLLYDVLAVMNCKSAILSS